MEKCKNTPETGSSQIRHPSSLVGCFATAVKDYPLGGKHAFKIRGSKVLVTGCRLKTETRLPEYEIMFEVLDSDFLNQCAEWLTIDATEVDEYLAGIHS